MRIPGLKALKAITRRMEARILGGAMILGYHRVADTQNDSFYNCVSPKHFNQHMEILKRYAHPLSIKDMLGLLEEGKVPPKTVCITIDDGYLDTLVEAKPIIEEHGIPTTVFVVTGQMGEEYWWDEIERHFVHSHSSIDVLDHCAKELDLGNYFKNGVATDRSKTISLIATRMSLLNSINRQQLLEKIRNWSGIDTKNKQPGVRSLTPAELILLGESKLIEIGSHTETHPVLPKLSAQERKFEMSKSKQVLEEILDKAVDGFSFPNGSFVRDDPVTVSHCGYRYACISENGLANSFDQKYTLPRFWPRNVDGEDFLRFLSDWMKI